MNYLSPVLNFGVIILETCWIFFYTKVNVAFWTFKDSFYKLKWIILAWNSSICIWVYMMFLTTHDTRMIFAAIVLGDRENVFQHSQDVLVHHFQHLLSSWASCLLYGLQLMHELVHPEIVESLWVCFFAAYDSQCVLLWCMHFTLPKELPSELNAYTTCIVSQFSVDGTFDHSYRHHPFDYYSLVLQLDS